MKTILCLMTFFLAFLGMIYEYVLAHYIASVVGGAYLILFVTFCFFAASLGFGSVLYNFVNERYKNLKFLGILQLVIATIILCLPSYFNFLSHGFLNSDWSYITVLVASAVPVLLLGIISGFELPLMFRLAYISISRLLVWDYLGMFVAIVGFPIIFVLGWHIHFVCYALASIAIIMAGLCFFLQSKFSQTNFTKDQEALSLSATSKAPEVQNINGFTLGIVFVFLMSFCSFAYQGLIGKVIISVVGDSFASRSYAIGFFILGMAMGAYLTELFPKAKLSALKRIITVEVSLCVLAAMAPIVLYFFGGSFFLVFGLSSISETQWMWYGSVTLSMMSLLVGFFSGMEMPLVFQWLGLDNESKESYYLIAANYIAAIFSGILIGFILPSFIGYSFSFILVILCNIAILLSIFLKFKNLKKPVVIALSVVIVFSFINAKLVYPSRQFFIETYYAKMHLYTWTWGSLQTTLKAISRSGSVFRIESFFQDIDIVSTEDNAIEGRDKLLYLYLNRQPQFNSETIKDYHQSMMWAGVSFLDQQPNQILILGGGDGLLVSELVKHYKDTKITVIELDPVMIDLAKNNNRIRILNDNALFNENVEVLIQDAYQFVRRTDERYDLVFIDFPYPTSIDLSRLYSFELYSGVKRVLTSSGVAIMDAPVIVKVNGFNDMSLDPQVPKIINTLYAAGFENPFAFGPYDPFIAVANDQRQLAFKESVREQVSNSVFTNLHSLEHSVRGIEKDPSKVNYVLKPTLLGGN